MMGDGMREAVDSMVGLVEDPEDPESYTLVTNLGPYTLAAVEHLDTWILFDFNYLRDHPDEPSIFRPENPNFMGFDKFRYQGEYYRCTGGRDVLAGWSPPRGWTKDWIKEIAAGIGISTVAVAAVAFIVYRKRKNQARARDTEVSSCWRQKRKTNLG